MKKKYLIIISCLLLTIFLLGCTETPAHISVSRSLDKNLNNLSYTVSKLDTIDNKTIANPDMYSTMQTSMNFTPSNNSSTRINLMQMDPQENLTNYLLNKMISNYTCDSNGNCYLCNNSFGDGRNANCSSCNGKIICDKNGNCTSCKTPLNLTNDGTCSNCNIKCVDGKCGDSTVSRFNADFPIVSSNNLNGSLNNNSNQSNCGSNYRNPLETNQISATTDDLSAENLNNIENESNNDSIVQNDNNNNDNLDSENYDESNYKDGKNSIKEDNELSNKDIIKNRFTSNYDKLENRNNQSFRNPIRKNQRDLQSSTLDNLDYLSANSESTTIEDEDIDSEFSYNQPRTLYYYSEESFTPDSLRYNPRFVSSYDETTTSDQLNNYVIKIQKLYAITSDVLEANNELASYKTTLLDKIENTKALNNEFQALTFEPNFYQVQALRNYLGDLQTTNSNLRAVNGSINDQINNISTNNPTITSSIDIMNSNYLKLLNQLDIRITYHKNALATLEQLSYILEDAMLNHAPETEGEITYDNEVLDDFNANTDNNGNMLVDDTIIDNNDTTNENNTTNNTNLDNTNTDNSNNTTNENKNGSTGEDNSTNQATNNSLIDTYANSSLKNIDTYKNEENTNIENNTLNTETNNNNLNENNNNLDNNSYNNLNNNGLTDNTIIDNNQTYNNNLTDNTTFDNNQTNADLNNTNNNENTNNENYLNNTNRNGVINQNNLNTDGNIENGSNYVYDVNGNLYNANNNNLLENNQTNNNVDTYSYNTLIDTINRGTVDNGINTLNISAVNSNVDSEQNEDNSNLQTLEYIAPETEEDENNAELNNNTDEVENLENEANSSENTNVENTSNEQTENNEVQNEDLTRDEGGIRKSIASCENGECETAENGDNMEQESNELNEKQATTLEEPSIEFLSDENI